MLNVQAQAPSGNAEAEDISVRDEITIRAEIDLGQLAPGDVIVQVYHGSINPEGMITEHQITPMATDTLPDGEYGSLCRDLNQQQDRIAWLYGARTAGPS